MRRTMALIAAVVLVGGCGSNESSLSDTIEGVWVTDLAGIFEVFHDDGSYGVGHSLELAAPDGAVRGVDGVLRSTAELEFGPWSTEGTILTMNPDAASAYCAGIVGTYEIDVLDDGNRLEVTVLDDKCSARAVDFGSGLTRSDNG